MIVESTMFLLAQMPVLTRDEEEFVTEFRTWPEGWWAVGGLALLALLCGAAVWMYRREGRMGASLRLRMILAAVRCAVICTLAVILLEPARVRILRRWIDSYTLLLVDDSASMDLQDRTPWGGGESVSEPMRAAPGALQDQGSGGSRDRAGGGVTEPARRAERVEQFLLADDRAFLRALAERNRVKVHAFDAEPTLRATIRAAREWRREGIPAPAPAEAREGALPPEAGEPEKAPGVAASTERAQALDVRDVSLALHARGPATNVERAVRRAVDALGSAPIAAVVVVSDGGFNQGSSAEDVARFARERRLPIYAVGVGDPAPPRNVAVTEILAPQSVFKQDPFAVTAQLSVQGMAGQTVSVHLRESGLAGTAAGSEARIVATREVTLGSDAVFEPITFQHRQDKPGRYAYTVETPVLEDETVPDDNARSVSVTVIDTRTRVLLVAGAPSWEYRYVSRLLTRDDTFDVSCWLQSADAAAVRDGNTVIDHLPRLPEELLAYDVVVLMDADPGELDEDWCRLLDRFVSEHSGGLLLTAARAHTPELARDKALLPLHDLLPVALDPEADLVLNRIGHYQSSGAPVDIPETALRHPVMQLGDDATATKLLWQDMTGVYWHFPVLREKPAATVLMRHGDPRMRNSFGGHVLAAVQFVGPGRTGFLAIDGTWRWRRHGAAHFDRFWVQWLRFLAEGKLLGGTGRGSIVTQSGQCSLGEAVSVSARLYDHRYEPLAGDEVTMMYEVEDRRGAFTLRARRAEPGWFEGRFVPEQTGSYDLWVTLSDAQASEPVELHHEIRVARPNIEVLRPQMDRASLTTLAEKSHGGRYFDLGQAGEVPELIPDLHEEIPIRSRPSSLWDNGWVLAGLVTLLAIEWALRKWNRLL